MSDPAPIWVLFHSRRSCRPQLSTVRAALRRPLLSLALWTSFLDALLVSLPPGMPFVSLAPCTLLVPAKPGGLLRTDCCAGCFPSRFFTNRCAAIFRGDRPVRRRAMHVATTNCDMRGAFGDGAMATAPCSGGVRLACTKVAPVTLPLLSLPGARPREPPSVVAPGPAAHTPSMVQPGGEGGSCPLWLCVSPSHLFRDGDKVLDCLPSGSFWTPFW